VPAVLRNFLHLRNAVASRKRVLPMPSESI
jgi:hypothetical protein